MLFVIHNLPKNTRYGDIKAMLTKRCGLTEFILDNLLPTKDDTMKVTVGLASDADAALLKRNVHGIMIDKYKLYVEDKKPKNVEQSRAPAETTARFPATYNIPAALQPPRNANPNQYIPGGQSHGSYGQNWATQTVGAQLGQQTATNTNLQMVQYPQHKFGQMGNYDDLGANQNQGWGSGNQNQGWGQSSHNLGWGNVDQPQGWAANNQNQSWAANNQNQNWAANNQQGWGSNIQNQRWTANKQNPSAKSTNQSQDWGANNQNQGWRSSNQKQGSGYNNENQGWSMHKTVDRIQIWEGNSFNQGSYSSGTQRRRSPSPMRSQNSARGLNAQDPYDNRPIDSEPTPQNRSRSPHRSRDQPNRPLRPSRPEPNRQQSGSSRFNSDEPRERSREIERSQPDGRGPQGGSWASLQTDQGNKRRWEDEHGQSLGPGPWRVRPPKKVRVQQAAAAVNPSLEKPKKKVTNKKMTKRNEYYRHRATTRLIDDIFGHLKLNQDDNVLKFYFKGPVRSRLGKLLGNAIDAKIDEMYDLFMNTYKHDEYQKIYEEAKLLQAEDKKFDHFLDSTGITLNKAESDAAAYLRPYKRDPKLLPPRPVNPANKNKKKRRKEKALQNAQNQAKPKVEQPAVLPIHKIPAFINNSKAQFKAMKQKHLQSMLTLECPQVDQKYQKFINEEINNFHQMFYKVLEQLDKPKKDYFKNCPINALALDFTKTVKQNICQRLTNTGFKIIRIYGAPLLPKKPALEAFLKNYGALSLKKSTRKFMYTAVINNYKNYDLLCNMEPVNLNGHSASFKPLHIAPKVPRKHIVANIKYKREKYIKDQIQKPLVNILDKDWITKLAALEEDIKYNKNVIDENIEFENAIVKTENIYDIKTDEIKQEENDEDNSETKLNLENDIKNEAFIENDDQHANLDIKEGFNAIMNQNIDFTADLDTNEFTSNNQNQSAGDNESELVSDNSMLKEYSGVSERKIIFDSDDEGKGNRNDEKQDDDKTDNQQQVNDAVEKNKQQFNDHLDDSDDDEVEFDDQFDDVAADDIDLDKIDDDDLEDY